MIRNELSDFLFIGLKFGSATVPLGLGSNGASLTTLFEETIEPRATHFIMQGEIVDRNTTIVILQNA